MQTIVKCLITCCVGLTLAQMGPEPEPDMYTTTMDETSTTEDETSTTPMVTTTTGITHTFKLSISLGSLAAYANEMELMSTIQNGMAGAAAGGNISVVIHAIHVSAEYGGFTNVIDQGVIDDIVEAVVAMSAVSMDQIKVNNQTHSSLSRRLDQMANVIVAVTNSPNVDVVAEASRVHNTSTPAGLSSKLTVVNASAYQSLQITLPNGASFLVSVTTVVSGTDTAPDPSSVEFYVGEATGGTVSVTEVSSPNLGTTPSGPAFQADTDDAPLAPMMIIWAFIYGFVSF